MHIALDARLNNNEKPARKAALPDTPARQTPAGDYRAGQEALSPRNQPGYEAQAEALRPSSNAAPAPVELNAQEYYALQDQLAVLEAQGHRVDQVYRGDDGQLRLRGTRDPSASEQPGLNAQNGPAIPYQPNFMTEAEFVACAKASHSLGGSLRISAQQARGRGGSHRDVCRDGKLGAAAEGLIVNGAKVSHGKNHGAKKNQKQSDLINERIRRDAPPNF